MGTGEFGELLRAASRCRSEHDPRFLIELSYEIARRHRDPGGPHYNGCPVCAGLNEIERSLQQMIRALIPQTALLDANAGVNHGDTE
jgi:hypothetical protein